jgi:peroxiredoxin
MNRDDAKCAARFASATKTESGSVTYKVSVPGHDSRRYLVLVRHEVITSLNTETGEITRLSALTGECLLDIGQYGTPTGYCPNTAKDRLPCYHILAAVIAIAERNELNCVLVDNDANVYRVKNLHGATAKAFRVAQHGSNRYVWAVTWSKEG